LSKVRIRGWLGRIVGSHAAASSILPGTYLIGMTVGPKGVTT
jgi:hypothetical protein